MITVVYCTRAENKEFSEHLRKTSGLHKHIEIIEIINNGESLTSCYNRGLSQAKNDIVVFCHDDLEINTKNWGDKLIKLMNRNKNYGILGIAGTKSMPVSGKWWENPKKMYGRVSHSHEGKTWLSAYSSDLNHEIEDAVVVDGLFFVVNKNNIKHKFNEEVVGFHFYDVTFCFENFLADVKIGVTTIIKITHKSIGMTNDEWEANRVLFAEKFKDKLPVSLKKKRRKGETFKVLLTSLHFDDVNPKSKIILELAKKLKKANQDVTICANMSGKIPNSAKVLGIGLAPIQQPPGFALGDGKWVLRTANGDIPSQPNTLYKVTEPNFSVIHVFDDEVIEHMNKLYNGTPIINTNQPNGLFSNTEKNSLVSSTIQISNDLKDVVGVEIDKIIDEYVNVI